MSAPAGASPAVQAQPQGAAPAIAPAAVAPAAEAAAVPAHAAPALATPAAPAPDGAAPRAAPVPVAVAAPSSNGDLPGEAYSTHTLTPEEIANRQMTRRELLTYAWAGALGLVVVGTGVSTFLFMYPRFRAGEFGGKFFLGPVSSMPTTDAPPLPNTSGKFWLVNTTDEGVKALYMVCTHLGCLYKWEPSTVRFECPCHGSKFSREGFYIEGPAPRSLDRFEVSEDAGVVVVDTGSKINGAPSSQSPARAEPA